MCYTLRAFFSQNHGDAVRSRNTNTVLRGTSILSLTGALILTIVSLIGYSRQRNFYPSGMTIGGDYAYTDFGVFDSVHRIGFRFSF